MSRILHIPDSIQRCILMSEDLCLKVMLVDLIYVASISSQNSLYRIVVFWHINIFFFGITLCQFIAASVWTSGYFFNIFSVTTNCFIAVGWFHAPLHQNVFLQSTSCRLFIWLKRNYFFFGKFLPFLLILIDSEHFLQYFQTDICVVVFIWNVVFILLYLDII